MAGVASIILGSVAAASSLAGGGLSFGQAAKQRKAQEKAQIESERLMQQARDRMQTRFYEQLQVPMEAYERQFRETTAQQKQALQALQESDPRTLAAGIGKLGAVASSENERIKEAMARDLFNLQKLKAEEQRAINEEMVGMDVAQAADQNIREREAAYARASAIQGGIAGIGGAVSAANEIVPLFSMSGEDRRAGRLFRGLSDTQKQNFLNKDGTRMSDTEIIEQLKLLTPDQQKALRKDPGSFDFNMFNVQQTDPKSAFMFLKQTPTVAPIVVDPNDFGLYQGVSPFSVK